MPNKTAGRVARIVASCLPLFLIAWFFSVLLDTRYGYGEWLVISALAIAGYVFLVLNFWGMIDNQERAATRRYYRKRNEKMEQETHEVD